jgi:hypothetical protein
VKGMVIRGVEGSKGRDGRGNGCGEGHRVSSGHGSAKLPAVNKGQDIERKFLIICLVGDSTGRWVNC